MPFCLLVAVKALDMLLYTCDMMCIYVHNSLVPVFKKAAKTGNEASRIRPLHACSCGNADSYFGEAAMVHSTSILESDDTASEARRWTENGVPRLP